MTGTWKDRLRLLLRQEWWGVLLFLLVNRLFLLGIGMMSRLLFQDVLHKNPVHILAPEIWLDMWANWDSGYLLHIARHGYDPTANIAVFPLYPFAVRILAVLTGNHFAAALLVSNLALVGTCIFLYKLVHADFGSAAARAACKFLILFPSSMVLSGVFSDSLCLLFMVASFYFARRERWLLASVCGCGATLTRIFSVVAAIPLFYEYLRQKGFAWRRIRADILFLALVPAGILIFFAYLGHVTGDFLAYIHVEHTKFGAGLRNPLFLLDDLWTSFRYQHVEKFFNSILPVLAGVVLTLSVRRTGVAYWLLGMGLIFAPVVAGAWLYSMSRYLAIVFPLFITVGVWSEKSSWRDALLTSAFAAVQGFVMGTWVFGIRMVV